MGQPLDASKPSQLRVKMKYQQKPAFGDLLVRLKVCLPYHPSILPLPLDAPPWPVLPTVLSPLVKGDRTSPVLLCPVLQHAWTEGFYLFQ